MNSTQFRFIYDQVLAFEFYSTTNKKIKQKGLIVTIVKMPFN